MYNTIESVKNWYITNFKLHTVTDINALKIRLKADLGVGNTMAGVWLTRLKELGYIRIKNVRNDVVERIK